MLVGHEADHTQVRREYRPGEGTKQSYTIKLNTELLITVREEPTSNG